MKTKTTPREKYSAFLLETGRRCVEAGGYHSGFMLQNIGWFLKIVGL